MQRLIIFVFTEAVEWKAELCALSTVRTKLRALKEESKASFFSQPICNLQPSNLPTKVSPYVLYNGNKHLFSSLIRGYLFKH
jgi:hypothetical protein